MQIKIQKKLSLISHEMGTAFLILNSTFTVRIFPGLLVFADINSKKSFQIRLLFQGPVKNFTVLQDIEKAEIKVFFHTKDGYFSYKILNEDKKFILYFEKNQNAQIKIQEERIEDIKIKEKIVLPIKGKKNCPKEHLFFGIHKKNDLAQIIKRQDPMEFLPFIFLYAQYFINAERYDGSLFRKLNELILEKKKNNLSEIFTTIFNVHFFEGFVPQANDKKYQNVIPCVEEKTDPLCILKECYLAIRSMLVSQNENELFILPCLDDKFYMGKASLEVCFGNLDIEWSKKILKKVIFRPNKDIQIKLILPMKIKTFRIRENLYRKGKFFQNGQMISFEKNKVYFLDRFQK